MPGGSSLGCVTIAIVVAGLGCNNDKDKPKARAVDFAARCTQLANACGDKPKHIEKIASQCTQAAQALVVPCTEKTLAAFDCYERELCGKADKIWALEDLGVLVERHGKCAAERAAALDCKAQ